MIISEIFGASLNIVEGKPQRILLDTDVDTDDLFALLYLLKLNRLEFQLEGVTLSANAWTNAGHAVNQVYDILYMMGRDDIAVGVGGEGGILPNGTAILPNVGGYLPIIEQGMTTAGDCRYRQAIPVGFGGRLDIDTNYGIRKAFLPRGKRKYTPLRQPTAQQVLIDKISAGPITLIAIGTHTNEKNTHSLCSFCNKEDIFIPQTKIAIIVSPTGWANAATIDVIYDLLHMMGRDDIKVGIGDFLYVKAIPHGNGGFLDSDTLFGFARDLPHSPRRYTAENTVKFGALRDTDHPELRQPRVMEIWESLLQTLKPGSKITVLTNGPLTNLAKVVSVKNISSRIQEVYVVGGHISRSANDKGNVFSVPSNKYAEFNMFLDPLAAKAVFQSEVNITFIPLSIQQKASSFSSTLRWLSQIEKTPETVFSKRILSRLRRLKKIHHRYQHMDTFLGEILGAVVLANGHSSLLDAKFELKSVKLLAEGIESTDGKMVVDEKYGKLVRILRHVDAKTYHEIYAKRLGDPNQSAKVGSFKEQKRKWSHPRDRS
ncbi:inosine-uridine preferring nucleoside hydrolase [Medicago truncatula]|uniref:Inosine-uridine preferring nucleoside hydrolase n=1 Tax=Medicago truncatula TaxID=3880 RepID=G7IFM4_MEDTR|nr:inosine-uridine preferring nucleoside hydrolase [Medicago truncatula]